MATHTKLAVILHADVVGSTSLVQKDERVAHERIRNSFRRFSETITAYGGITHEVRGDALVAEFARASDGVSACLAFQVANTDQNAGLVDDIRPEIRVGIALGEVVIADNTVTGPGVVLAQRIEQLAEPGGFCISAAIHEAVPKRLPVEFKSLGDQSVKGFDEPVRVYSVSLRAGEKIPEPVNDVYSDDSAAKSSAPMLALPDKPSIAVLPFNNLSGDPDQEYFADGMTEDITTALSKLRWFLVIARNSTFVYKGLAVDVKQAGRELGVDYVVEGSVQKAGNRLRISAQLIDGTTGNNLWAEKYDRELADIFDVQDEITQTVVATIEPKLVAAEGVRSQRRSGEDLNAWRLVMRAMSHFGKMTSKESQTAIALLEEAVQKYPDYGPAHSLLAFALLVSGHVGWIPKSGVYGYSTKFVHRAGELARHAAELDYEDPWAHFVLGNYCFIERRTEEAVREYLKAIDLNPNFAIAYGSLGRALVFDGQSEDAVNYFQKALRMSPHDPLITVFYSGMGTAHYYAHRYDEAIAWSRKAIRERPGYTAAHRILCASLAMAGRTEDAEAAAATLRQLQPNISIAWVEQHVPYTPRAMPHFLDGMRKAGVPES